MKILYPIFLNCVLMFNLSFGQVGDGIYFDKLRPIDKAIYDHDFATFKALFRSGYYGAPPDTGTKTAKMRYLNDQYFYAAVLSLGNHRDSAFYFLNKIIRFRDFENYDGILGDVAFGNLRSDRRWKDIETSAKSALRTSEYSNPDLRIRLLTIGMTDQSNILFNDTTQRKKVIGALIDSVVMLIDHSGYPKLSEVGSDAAIVPALILAHANLGVQLKYKDMIYTEGLKGNIPGGYAGLLLDKIQVKGTQLYGTQYQPPDTQHAAVYFYPVEDSLNLERRRKNIGFTISYPDYKTMIQNQYRR